MGDNISNLNSDKKEVGVRCCGVTTTALITPPGPEKIKCSVCGEEYYSWA